MNASSFKYSEIWKIALPIMIGGVAQNLVNVTDTAFLGQVGEVELGAAGSAGILYFIFVITGMGFTTGSQIIIGRRNGEKQYSKIGGIVDQSFYFMIPFGILMIIGLSYYMPIILKSIINSENIYNASIDFMQYRSFGIIFAFIIYALNAFYVGITKTRILIYTTILMSLTNVFFDYVLIFGNWGFPEMGIKGAALASVISEFVACFFLLTVTFKTVDKEKYLLFKFKKPNLEILKKTFYLSAPIMVQSFITLGSWYAFFSLIESMGEKELAISHIIRSIYMVMMIPMFGLSTSANTITSNLIGSDRQKEVLPTVWKIVGLSMICTLPFVIINLIFPTQIIGLYTNNPEIIEGCLNTLNVINVSMFFFCFAFIFFNSVTGTGNTKISLLIEFVNISIYLISAFLVIKIFSPSIEWVWCTEFIYFTFLALMSWFYIKKGNWSAKKI